MTKTEHTHGVVPASAYDASDLLRIRQNLDVSQAIMARLLAVKLITYQSWEQGLRLVPRHICRLADLLETNAVVFLIEKGS